MTRVAGASRYDANRRRHTRDQAIALPMEPRLNDALAHEAELLVARRYELPTMFIASSRPDVGYDFALARRGCRTTFVDVKWSPRDVADLLVGVGKLRAHAYVLVTGDAPERMTIRGFAWRHSLRLRTEDKGHGPVHIVSQDDLRNADILFASCGYAPRTNESRPTSPSTGFAATG